LITNLARELERSLPPQLLDVVRLAGEICRKRGEHLYLVGGVVRDLILARPNLDLDLVVEGDAGEVAKSLAQRVGGKVVTHPRFGTAKVRYADGSADLAAARAEIYSRPGALPTVRRGTIEEDLLRRDFTTNAMAVNLDVDGFGVVLDPCGGRKDIEQRCIRILHDRSFIDDATRMLRAVRYEQRLGFHLASETEGLLRRDVAMLDTISGDRIRHELELILKEDEPEKALKRASDLGLLSQIYPPLKADDWIAERFRRTRAMAISPFTTYLLLLVYRLSAAQAGEFMKRLKFTRTTVQGVEDTLRLRDNLCALSQPQTSRSRICEVLEGYALASIAACAIATDDATISERLQLYLDKLRHVKPSLNGRALQEMGLQPGERLGEILRALRWAKLDQKVRTRSDEETLVRTWLSEGQGG